MTTTATRGRFADTHGDVLNVATGTRTNTGRHHNQPPPVLPSLLSLILTTTTTSPTRNVRTFYSGVQARHTARHLRLPLQTQPQIFWSPSLPWWANGLPEADRPEKLTDSSPKAIWKLEMIDAACSAMADCPCSSRTPIESNPGSRKLDAWCRCPLVCTQRTGTWRWRV